MEKQRIVPTHFIDCWKGKKTGHIFTEKIQSIFFLDMLNLEKRTENKTVWIWKIAPKEYHSETYLKGIGSIGKTVLPLETLKNQ